MNVALEMDLHIGIDWICMARNWGGWRMVEVSRGRKKREAIISLNENLGAKRRGMADRDIDSWLCNFSPCCRGISRPINWLRWRSRITHASYLFW
jgi:hypothetical protein